MKGARALLETLVASGVDTCFMNPGTSEMHSVAALDDVSSLRPVLTLFEGVATGAADGYGRMAERPAATLLHLGPGLGNGIANLHNARRGRTPLVNIVGDHATYHKRFDAPLESDIESLAKPVSSWYRWCPRADDVVADATAAVEAALGPPGCVATLVLPADVSWLEVDDARVAPSASTAVKTARRSSVRAEVVAAAAAILSSGEPAALLLGGSAVRRRPLLAASRVAQRTGARLLAEPFPARLERGSGLPGVERLAYLGELATAQMASLSHLLLVDARAPVAPFAYPGMASVLVPEGCQVHVLAGGNEDAAEALEALAAELGAPGDGACLISPSRPAVPPGRLTAAGAAAVIGALLPENAIVSDESITAGIHLGGACAGAPPHDVLSLTGNSIGQGLPLATGAAVACPDRPVLALEADGSAMYTIQALWTQAREGLDVTTVIYDNGSYAILNLELNRVGAEAGGERARAMLDLGSPDIGFAAISEGLGVPAARVETTEELSAALSRAFAEDGPHLVHAVLPRGGF